MCPAELVRASVIRARTATKHIIATDNSWTLKQWNIVTNIKAMKCVLSEAAILQQWKAYLRARTFNKAYIKVNLTAKLFSAIL